MEEIALACEALRALSRVDKINVGALGNIVRQPHVHIVAREIGDAAWPGPVWGVGAARRDHDSAAAELVADIRRALALVRASGRRQRDPMQMRGRLFLMRKPVWQDVIKRALATFRASLDAVSRACFAVGVGAIREAKCPATKWMPFSPSRFVSFWTFLALLILLLFQALSFSGPLLAAAGAAYVAGWLVHVGLFSLLVEALIGRFSRVIALLPIALYSALLYRLLAAKYAYRAQIISAAANQFGELLFLI